MSAIDIMLVSHTNAGKTTLVRTLLGSDVGEILDAPDVTRAVVAYDLIAGEDGNVLRLWDTPGFGDSFRLARRLRLKYRWLAWIVRELWDRYRNPRLWRGQRVVLDLRERAAVVLYLVNSVERPVDAVYVAPELEVLGWIGKPVLAILNQGGGYQPGNESQQIGEWRQALAHYPVVSKTLALDSFTRCWVQELVLYEEIGRVLPEDRRAAYQTLAQSVQAGHGERLAASTAAIAAYLLALARDRVELETSRFGRLKDIFELIRKKIPWGKAEQMQAHEQAMEAMAQRYMEQTKALTGRLIEINRLSGVSSAEILRTAGTQFSVDGPVDESTTALAGGVISGALAGLGADLLAGGLTLGTGALVGAVLGALGATALARGYNIHADKGKKAVSWSSESLTEAFVKSVMLYLAIAHFGRGQGEWRRKDDPAHWGKVVGDAVERYRVRLQSLWTVGAADANATASERECAEVLRRVLVEVLNALYPEIDGYLSSASLERNTVQLIDLK